jgi:hypothetical protein
MVRGCEWILDRVCCQQPSVAKDAMEGELAVRNSGGLRAHQACHSAKRTRIKVADFCADVSGYQQVMQVGVIF